MEAVKKSVVCGSLVGAAMVTCVVGGASATVLTFSSVSTSTINQAYGDRVTALSDAAGTYLEGFGFTPNVTVDYVTTSTPSPFTVYSSGYGSLSAAVGHASFGVNGFVRLVPDAGTSVVLHSFDVAAWVIQRSGRVVVRAGGAVVFDSGTIAIPGTQAPGNSLTFTPTVVSPGPIEIELEDFGDLAIDNISFSQLAGTVGIGDQPDSVSPVDADTGASATFSVLAFGPGTLSYRWLLDGVPVADGPVYSGATTATLTVSNIGGAQEGRYSCRVISSTPGVLPVESLPALLPVIGGGGGGGCAADFNGDGGVNIFDILGYFAAFGAGC